MKKKNVIIPAICIALSLTAMLTMTVFTTPASIVYSSSKNTYNHMTDYYTVFKETHRIMEIVMKLDPSFFNSYYASVLCFNPQNIGDAKYLEICKDYEKKSLEYAEKHVDAAKKSGNVILYYSMTTDEHEYQVAGATADYVTALWYAGKKDEAKKVMEDYVHTLTKDNISCAFAFEMEQTLFIISTTGNDADREWLNGIEQYIVDFHNDSIDYKHSTGDYGLVEINRWEIGENGHIERIYEEE